MEGMRIGRMVYLYMLTDPTGAETAYIGASTSPKKRLAEHRHGSSSRRMRPWLAMLRHRGLRPTLTVLDTLFAWEAKQAEMDAIAMCKAIRGVHCLNTVSHSAGLRVTK